MRRTTTSGAGIVIAALALVGCAGDPPEEPEPTETVTETATPTDEPTPTTEPTETAEPEGQWAEPTDVDASMDIELDADLPVTVRWVSAGETLRVYTSGSSSQGCVPTPIEAWTDGAQVEIEFEPVEPMTTCTADMVMHAWEIAWDEPFTVDGPLPLYLTDVEQAGEQIDTELPAEPYTP